MNINRNNYEEYFLLYTDKELSAEEKSMVEMFVKQNPDLEEEFIMLQQSVVKPDTTITLEDKSSLFRTGEFINRDNYEEKFLLYTDNELSLDEIEETEKFVLSNPSLQNEFTLLQKVVYQPDMSIVFPDKSLLYKKEKDGKVIPFRWKALAAAILLGIGLWTGITYIQKDKTDPVIVRENIKPKKDPVKPIEPVEKKEDNRNLAKTEDPKVPVQKTDPGVMDNTIKKQQPVIVKNNMPNNVPLPNQLPEPKKEDIAVVETTKKVDVPKASNNLPEPNNTDRIVEKTTLPVVENNNHAQYASYIADAEVKNENYVFYNITTEEFKKSKIGNFLKKAKRVIENRIPFRGKGLKIGNVEIAKDE